MVPFATSLFFGNTWCQKFLERLLEFLGLLSPKAAPFYRHIPAIIIFLLSVLSLIYETVYIVTNFVIPESGRAQLVNVLDRSQHVLKALSTLVILLMFWQKSSHIIGIRKRLNAITTSMIVENNTTEYLVAGTVWVIFFLYLVSVITIRVTHIIVAQSPSGHWNLISFPWIKINVLEEQILNTFLRNWPESIRLLCSGYLGLMLCRFEKGLAAQCRLQLGIDSKNNHALMPDRVEKAWNAREQALALAATIQKELGLLLALIIFGDILSVNCTVASFLFEGDITRCLRKVAAVLLYLGSLFSITVGLISLMDEVRHKP
jgi:hypothetical protein